jgi:hypothetical protein
MFGWLLAQAELGKRHVLIEVDEAGLHPLSMATLASSSGLLGSSVLTRLAMTRSETCSPSRPPRSGTRIVGLVAELPDVLDHEAHPVGIALAELAPAGVVWPLAANWKFWAGLATP